MNQITKAERKQIEKRAEQLTRGKQQRDDMGSVMESLIREFSISKDRAKSAAAHGFRYWRNPSQK